MQYDDINNDTLRELIRFAHKNGSVTVIADMDDAINSSDTEEDLIQAWQDSLEFLRDECRHYWGTLETFK